MHGYKVVWGRSRKAVPRNTLLYSNDNVPLSASKTIPISSPTATCGKKQKQSSIDCNHHRFSSFAGHKDLAQVCSLLIQIMSQVTINFIISSFLSYALFAGLNICVYGVLNIPHMYCTCTCFANYTA